MRDRSWDQTDIHPSCVGDQETGFFEWEVAEDLLHADGAVAKLFGFRATDAENGLSVLAYVGRIHPDDRKHVARAIHNSLVTCAAFRESYRIQHPDGSVVDVQASGRCFRNRNGDPAHFSGVIQPAKPKPKHLKVHRWAAPHSECRKPFGPVAANNA